MKKTDFLVPFDDYATGKVITTVMKGRILIIEGVVCYVHLVKNVKKWWAVSHYESGMQISSSGNRMEAISYAREKILLHPEIRERAKEQLCRNGFVYPLNTIPKKYVRN